MTHNYARDRFVLPALLTSDVFYVGALGPKRRTEQLLDEIGRYIHRPTNSPVSTPPPASTSVPTHPKASLSRSSARSKAFSQTATAATSATAKARSMTANSKAKIGGLLLAAGGSSRLGQPKQLLEFEGKTLIRRAAETLVYSQCEPIVVVLGAEIEYSAIQIADLSVSICINENWQTGMSSSIISGLGSLLRSSPNSMPSSSHSAISRTSILPISTNSSGICRLTFADSRRKIRRNDWRPRPVFKGIVR